jgi:hypothetical protein
MADTAEAQRILDAAEHAAADGDYASAERLLREAASLQERTLGPVHPDLANTLNNLGVVCERAGKDDDAEQCYRRAYAIATTAFASDHPFVATSRKNLEEFCAARGRAIDGGSIKSAFARSATAGSRRSLGEGGQDPPHDTVAEFESETGPSPSDAPRKKDQPTDDGADFRSEPSSVRVSEPPSPVLPIGAVVVAVVSIAIVVIGWLAWPSSSDKNDGQSAAPEAARAPVASPAPPPPEPTTKVTPPPPPEPTRQAPPSPPKAKPATSSITVADARLCTSLTTSGEWRCDQLRGTIDSGAVFFFTRVISPRETTIQHRWYLGDRLQQNVMLDIAPNGAGYRTYSRRTISAALAGEWRVELRTEDGQLLREERFTVH